MGRPTDTLERFVNGFALRLSSTTNRVYVVEVEEGGNESVHASFASNLKGWQNARSYARSHTTKVDRAREAARRPPSPLPVDLRGEGLGGSSPLQSAGSQVARDQKEAQSWQKKPKKSPQ